MRAWVWVCNDSEFWNATDVEWINLRASAEMASNRANGGALSLSATWRGRTASRWGGTDEVRGVWVCGGGRE